MTTYTSMSGKTYTDDDIERWAADAENGKLQGKPGPTYYGPMPSPAELAADIERLNKVKQVATALNVPPAQVVRDLIDALLDVRHGG